MVDITETKVFAHINREFAIVLNRLVKKRLDDILGALTLDKLIGETRTAESCRYAKRHYFCLFQLCLGHKKYIN
jgi:hypothetical protein